MEITETDEIPNWIAIAYWLAIVLSKGEMAWGGRE